MAHSARLHEIYFFTANNQSINFFRAQNQREAVIYPSDVAYPGFPSSHFQINRNRCCLSRAERSKMPRGLPKQVFAKNERLFFLRILCRALQLKWTEAHSFPF